MNFKFGEKYEEKASLGDTVQLQTGDPIEVVACQETDVLMLNIDADQIKRGDLSFIKSLGLTISNPDTDKPVALGVDYKPDSFGHRLSSWFAAAAAVAADAASDYDDDSSFFSSSGSFGGGSSWGGGSSSGGGFGGFGGGSFSGGGASASF